MDSIYLLQLVLAVLVMAIIADTLSKRFKLPVLIFLLIEGILIGPEVLGVLDPSILGDGLTAIVSLCVSVIVFDGGLHIDVKSVRTIQKGVLKLVTLGLLITFVSATIICYLVIGFPLQIAALFGALVTATGPTVITPIVRSVRVNHKVSKLLEIEGILNDAGSVILAALVFEWIVSQLSGVEVIEFIAYRIFIGLVMGVASGIVLIRFLSLKTALSAQTVKFVTFTMVIATYVISETFGNESGILAVAIFGIIVGTSNVPYKAALKDFKANLVFIMLALIFILLAAMLRFEDITRIGIMGVVVILLLMFVVRPLAVFISTIGTSFTTKEKLFISFVGPRGVVPASIAIYFAMRLNLLGMDGGQELVGLMFLTVIMTVVVTGTMAKHVAKRLGVISMEILIAGGGEVGYILAERFEKRGHNVVVVDALEENCEKLMEADIRVVHGDAENIDVLKKAGIENSKYVVATTDQDNTNLMVCQIAKAKFGFTEDQIIARVNNMENLHAFWDLNIRSMSPAMGTAMVLDNMVGRSNMFTMCGVSGGAETLEARVTNPKVVGKAIKELSLPKNSLLVMVRRGDDSFIANGNMVLEQDDIVSIIGEGDAAKDVQELLNR
ncbi:MAG: cation:proton antiporter [Methanosarcinaceae archaeon]|nr:cation:proton antiporter [Methanosarcinaceae archaeon]